MSINASIEAVEREMAGIKAALDAKNTSLEQLRAELDVLNAAVIEAQAQVDAKVEEINAARGDPQAWIALKKKYGQLASARMQLRQAAGLTPPT